MLAILPFVKLYSLPPHPLRFDEPSASCPTKFFVLIDPEAASAHRPCQAEATHRDKKKTHTFLALKKNTLKPPTKRHKRTQLGFQKSARSLPHTPGAGPAALASRRFPTPLADAVSKPKVTFSLRRRPRAGSSADR
jgi:hypothetical protein